MAESVKCNEENYVNETAENNRVGWDGGRKVISDKITFMHKSERKSHGYLGKETIR